MKLVLGNQANLWYIIGYHHRERLADYCCGLFRRDILRSDRATRQPDYGPGLTRGLWAHAGRST